MDDPSDNYKLSPIIIRSPRSSYGTSSDKGKKYQKVKVSITDPEVKTDDNNIIEQEIESTFQPSEIKKAETIPFKNDENW